jgi:predicted esterase
MEPMLDFVCLFTVLFLKGFVLIGAEALAVEVPVTGDGDATQMRSGSFRKMALSLSTTVADVPSGTVHKGTVIWMHGLGDTADGWIDTMQDLQSQMPHVRFVLPTAPVQPVTLNNGYRMTSWHDIKSLSNINDEDFEGLDESLDAVRAIVAEESKRDGMSSDKIVIGGFSQGAAMSLLLGYTYPETLAGIVAFSGYLPRYQKFKDLLHESNKKTPAYVGHGTADEVVKLKAGVLTDKILTENEIPHEFKQFPRMGHSACPQEMRDLAQFLSSRLPA